MKPFTLFLSMCFLLVVRETTLAQVAADYYLPLRVGNYLELYTPGNQVGYSARSIRYTIEGSDFISGQLYFRDKGIEIEDNDVFRVLWLRKDSEGNILLGAAAFDEFSPNVDSSTVIDPPIPLFPNEFIVPGYSYSLEGFSVEYTTMSNTETVQVPAGTFTNCIKRREIERDTDSGDVIFLEYQYYAQGIGLVMNVREIPAEDAHTDVLVRYNATTPLEVQNELAGPTGFILSQNYPNPFNPTTEINFVLPNISQVSLEVFNALGQKIATLVDEKREPGNYRVKWDGDGFPSGVYFYCLKTEGLTKTMKMLLMK